MDATPVGTIVNGLRFATPREAQDLVAQGALLVDLRADELVEMKEFGVPEWIHIPHPELAGRLEELPKDRLLLLADTSGVYLRAAVQVLREHGFERIVGLNGGMLCWDQEGFPVRTDANSLLHGECACVMMSKKDRAARGRR